MDTRSGAFAQNAAIALDGDGAIGLESDRQGRQNDWFGWH
jgi:hypothetical protein